MLSISCGTHFNDLNLTLMQILYFYLATGKKDVKLLKPFIPEDIVSMRITTEKTSIHFAITLFPLTNVHRKFQAC